MVEAKTPLKFWKELSWFEIGAIVSVIVFFFYLKNFTALVPNISLNETRIINGISYPPNTLIYPPNALVPKSNVTNTQTFFGMLLFLIVVLMLITKRLSIRKRATMKEAMDDISKQIKQLKNITLADGTTIPITDDIDIKMTPQFLSKYKTVGEVREVVKYAFLVYVIDRKNQVEHYFRAWYHPMNWYWDGFFETQTPLRDIDKCSHCGGELSDEKIITSEELSRLREVKKALGIGRL